MSEETKTPKRELNGAEALMGFLCWMTTREEPLTLSRYHNATLAIEVFEQFSRANDIGSLGSDWPHCVTPPEPITTTNEEREPFEKQLERLINRCGLESGSDTPDFLLADYLSKCLITWTTTIAKREAWYGRPIARKQQL